MSSVSGSLENGSIVHVDEEKIRGHVDEVVRSSVEATLLRAAGRRTDSCAVRSVTNDRRTASTVGPAATTASFRRKQARSH